MPKCNPRCPIVKKQLRELASEAPWVFKELSTKTGKAVSLFGSLDEKVLSARVDIKREDDLKSAIDTYDDPHDRLHKEEKDAMVEHLDDKIVLERRIRTSATQYGSKEDVAKLDDVDKIDRTDRASGIDTVDGVDRIDRTDRTSSTIRMDEVKKLDKETLKREVVDEATESAMFRDECELSCPRRISRTSRLRKLEETQCIIDAYLLNKGARYFEDVCTCSLSCVLRALWHDPFITSTFASVALFTLGLKLCSELDAWYLPIRF